MYEDATFLFKFGVRPRYRAHCAHHILLRAHQHLELGYTPIAKSTSCMVWYGMVEVCEGAPVAVSGWVLTDRHDLAPCAANSLHRATISVNNIIGGTGTLGIA